MSCRTTCLRDRSPLAAFVSVCLATLATDVVVPAQDLTLLASDGEAGDLFGGAATSVFFGGGPGLAASGDVIVVGAFGDDVGGLVDAGSATVFERVGEAWVERQRLLPAAPVAEAWFGLAVAQWGDLIAVGAPHDPVSGFAQAGSVTVFRRDGAIWLEEQRVTGVDGFDWFGAALALDGDTLAVGAPLAAGVGSVTVFRRGPTTWTQEAVLVPSDVEVADSFGSSVSLCGDVLVAGSPVDDVGGQVARGSATVFRRAGTTWTEEQRLLAAAGAAGDLLGAAAVVRGDLVVLGAPRADGPSGADEGALTLFRWDGATWLEDATLRAPSPTAGDRFGASVATSGGRVLAGAPGVDLPSAADAGLAVLLREEGPGWIADVLPGSASPAFGDGAGSAVALCGGSALVGVPFDDVGAQSDRGSVALHAIDAPAWSDLGFALPGALGPPRLEGLGDLCPGSANALLLTQAAPSAPAALFLAFASTPVPFKGGTLVPFPFVPPIVVDTDPFGAIPLAFAMPAGVPPASGIWVQWAVLDAGAPAGVALSNAVLGVTP